MDKKCKAYIVTCGEYSDYRIDRVFSTRKKAMEYLDTKDDDYRIEEYDVDEPTERKMQIYRVAFRLDKKDVCGVMGEMNNSYKDLINVRKAAFDDSLILDIYVESDSNERAVKVASERYGAIIANEQTMYPFLRIKVLESAYLTDTAFFDFYTGELVLRRCDRIAFDLPPYIKVRKFKD